jgi:hypothetical protein
MLKTHEQVGEQRVVFVRHQPSAQYHCFVFAVYNRSECKHKALFDQNRKRYDNPFHEKVEKSYVFVVKQVNQMKEIIESKRKIPLIQDDDEVLVLRDFRRQQMVPWRLVKQYQMFDLSDIRIKELLSTELQSYEFLRENPKIHLTFAKQLKIKASMNLISFIYQEAHTEKHSYLLLFDIPRCQILNRLSVASKTPDLLFKDEMGFNTYSLCRTSNVQEGENKE